MIQAGKKLSLAAITAAVIVGCSADSNNDSGLGNAGTPSAGNADFTTYVALGDSLTAGYADGALYLLGQQNSFPAILAQQFSDENIGGGDFVQPLLTDSDDPAAIAEANLGGLLVGGTPGFIENRFALDTVSQTPVRVEGDSTLDVVGTGLNGTAFNNMGIPGAKSFHLVAAGYGAAAGLPATASPYFVRFVTDNATAPGAGPTVMEDAAAQQATFFTIWIGNNDILGYATSGGDGSDPITDTATFDGAYAAIVGAMTGANPDAKGVLINLPDVNSIPFFDVIPYLSIPMTADEAAQANAGWDALYNDNLDLAVAGNAITQEEADRRRVSFVEGINPVVILDETLTPIGGPETFIRQATAEDLILFTAGTILGEEIGGDPTMIGGVTSPLTDEYVLIPSEIEEIDTARAAFNDTIAAAAEADDNLVLFDAAAVLADVKANGYSYGTGSVTSDFATGGAFSLDGVHPTARGYSIVANEVIDVINASFDANVYKVDPSAYPTIFFK